MTDRPASFAFNATRRRLMQGARAIMQRIEQRTDRLGANDIPGNGGEA